MNGQRASLEVIAPDVEEAIAKGLAELGLTEDAVEVEVLDIGSRGLFGLGSRQARVRLTIKSSSGEIVPPPVEVEADKVASIKAGSMVEEVEEQPIARIEVAPPPAEEDLESPREVEETEEDAEFTLQVAREIVVELLERMQVYADVKASFGEPDDFRSRTPVLVEVYGKDLAFLIGRRAETLNALQYVASLIVGKELGRSIPLIIDVEGYRQRRAQQLRQLALRMADQAIKTGRRQILEPMPANERRLIHIELRDHPDVTTESIDEEPNRKVTIVPKKV